MKQRAARANHFNLQAKCASHLSDSLKDPNSMRIIDGSYGARGDRKIVVNLTYTAKNSFGGRVKESRTPAPTPSMLKAKTTSPTTPFNGR